MSRPRVKSISQIQPAASGTNDVSDLLKMVERPPKELQAFVEPIHESYRVLFNDFTILSCRQVHKHTKYGANECRFIILTPGNFFVCDPEGQVRRHVKTRDITQIGINRTTDVTKTIVVIRPTLEHDIVFSQPRVIKQNLGNDDPITFVKILQAIRVWEGCSEAPVIHNLQPIYDPPAGFLRPIDRYKEQLFRATNKNFVLVGSEFIELDPQPKTDRAPQSSTTSQNPASPVSRPVQPPAPPKVILPNSRCSVTGLPIMIPPQQLIHFTDEQLLFVRVVEKINWTPMTSAKRVLILMPKRFMLAELSGPIKRYVRIQNISEVYYQIPKTLVGEQVDMRMLVKVPGELDCLIDFTHNAKETRASPEYCLDVLKKIFLEEMKRNLPVQEVPPGENLKNRAELKRAPGFYDVHKVMSKMRREALTRVLNADDNGEALESLLRTAIPLSPTLQHELVESIIRRERGQLSPKSAVSPKSTDVQKVNEEAKEEAQHSAPQQPEAVMANCVHELLEEIEAHRERVQSLENEKAQLQTSLEHAQQEIEVSRGKIDIPEQPKPEDVSQPLPAPVQVEVDIPQTMASPKTRSAFSPNSKPSSPRFPNTPFTRTLKDMKLTNGEISAIYNFGIRDVSDLAYVTSAQLCEIVPSVVAEKLMHTFGPEGMEDAGSPRIPCTPFTQKLKSIQLTSQEISALFMHGIRDEADLLLVDAEKLSEHVPLITARKIMLYFADNHGSLVKPEPPHVQHIVTTLEKETKPEIPVSNPAPLSKPPGLMDLDDLMEVLESNKQLRASII